MVQCGAVMISSRPTTNEIKLRKKNSGSYVIYNTAVYGAVQSASEEASHSHL